MATLAPLYKFNRYSIAHFRLLNKGYRKKYGAQAFPAGKRNRAQPPVSHFAQDG
jgi:hypothetical protein